jgi:hypothetical protein
VKANVRFTFQDDKTAYENREMVESDCLLWANDFPHTDSTWPWSQEILAAQTSHLSEERRNAAVHDNVRATFNLPV